MSKFDVASMTSDEINAAVPRGNAWMASVAHCLALGGRTILPQLCNALQSQIGLLGRSPRVTADGLPYVQAIPYEPNAFKHVWMLEQNQQYARRSGFKEDYEAFLIVPLDGADELIALYGNVTRSDVGNDYEETLDWCIANRSRAHWLAIPLESDRDALLLLTRDPAVLRVVLSTVVAYNPAALLSFWGGSEIEWS